MSGVTDLATRVRGWARWFLYGDLSFDWLRPRRISLPALMVGTLVALMALHGPSGGDCVSPGSCTRMLQTLAEYEPMVLAGTVGFHFAAAAVVYVVAAGATSLVGRRVDLASVAPELFAPDDAALRAVAVLGLVALLTYVAGAYHLAYGVVGIAALYVLYFPVLVPAAAFISYNPPDPVGAPLAAVVLVALPFLEVLWLYALAHVFTSLFRSDDATDRTVHR